MPELAANVFENNPQYETLKEYFIDKLQISSTFVQKESSIFDENIFDRNDG